MARFTDGEGREWSLRLTVGGIKRVKEAMDMDLSEVIESDTLERLQHVLTATEVLWLLIEPEAERHGVTAASFGESLAGDEYAAALEALLEAVVDFSPGPRRAMLRRMLEASKTLQGRAADEVEKRISGGVLDEAIDELLAGIDRENPVGSSGSATGLPGLSGSIPTATACASSTG
ncbi:MAG: hypothetical protein AAGI68_15970 [Planctomycetota bacterium]